MRNIHIETEKNTKSKKKIITGIVLVSIVGVVWVFLRFFYNNSIEVIAEDISEPPTSTGQELEDSLTMSTEEMMNGEEIINDVFIGDSDETEEESDSSIESKYTAFVTTIEKAVEEKDFKTLCDLSSQCNSKSTDQQKLAQKEKEYASHTVKYFSSKIADNVLCYTETIRLKNDTNKHPIIYTYHVAVKEDANGHFELQKPRCEKVVKDPYGDITNRSPYNTRCGANVTRLLCEEI